PVAAASSIAAWMARVSLVSRSPFAPYARTSAASAASTNPGHRASSAGTAHAPVQRKALRDSFMERAPVPLGGGNVRRNETTPCRRNETAPCASSSSRSYHGRRWLNSASIASQVVEQREHGIPVLLVPQVAEMSADRIDDHPVAHRRLELRDRSGVGQ